MTDMSNRPATHVAMAARDREMIPRILLRAMLGLVLLSLALTTYATVTDRPLVGTPDPAEVIASRALILEGTRLGAVTVFDADGTLLADHDPTAAGFISVVWRALERERNVHGITTNPPVTVEKLANGRMALTDPATGWNVELAFFGDQNAARFAALIDQ